MGRGSQSLSGKEQRENSKPRSRGGPFPKGVSGNPAGRPKGTRNKASIEIKLFFRELLDDPIYAHGKPAQSIDLGVSFDPEKYLEGLARRAAAGERT